MRIQAIATICSVVLTTACTPIKIELASSFTTSNKNLAIGKRTVTTQFKSDDTINFYSDFKWEDLSKPAGRKIVVWNWYSENGKLVSTAKRNYYFNEPPFELRSSRAASALGLGKFKVEIVVDEQVMASQEFEISKD